MTLLATLLVAPLELVAQARIARSEFICYDRREDAVNDVRTNIDNYIVILSSCTI